MTLLERLALGIDCRGPDDCWPWTRGKSKDGYGLISYGPFVARRMLYVHRLVWEKECGPIPEGMTIDHLCFNRACANAAHMELVTLAENGRRAAEKRWRG